MENIHNSPPPLKRKLFFNGIGRFIVSSDRHFHVYFRKG